ncbi:MAG: hypothetical protein PHP22_10520, partial [Oscillospiraceae bacterium]|nr:hypothetical protein [Oscillospiraceae bacterium]
MTTIAGFRRHFLYASILSIMIIGLLFSTGCYSSNDEFMTSSEQDLFIVTETYTTEFILYGDDMNLDPACHVKKIDAITGENLQMDDTYKFSVLVINDINENAPVSDDELKLLISIVDQGKLPLFYFGKRLINPIISEGNYTTFDI